jgi:hypothetical protein
MTLIKKIGNVALKTLGWTALPEVMMTVAYCKKYSDDNEWTPFPEIGVFFLSTAITIGATYGTNKLYESKVNKEYSTKNITIEVKYNASLKDNDNWGPIPYLSPLLGFTLMQTSKDITKIKTKNLTMEIENTNVINFDEINGFTLTKDAYYNNNFRILKNFNGDKKWVEYRQNENIEVSAKYEKLKQKIEKIKYSAIKSGNIGKIIALQDSMIKIETNYELKKIELKKTQLILDSKLTDVVNQLNTEYATYMNTPANIAIPKRDYTFTK